MQTAKAKAVRRPVPRSRKFFWFLNRTINPFVRLVLRSPLHSLLDRSLVLITYTGRRTGKEYTLPVQFAKRGEELIIVPFEHERKMWWRNLRVESMVRVQYQGTWLECSAVAFEGGEDAAPRLETYLKRFPSSARLRGVTVKSGEELTTEVLRAASRTTVVVVIKPTRWSFGQSPAG